MENVVFDGRNIFQRRYQNRTFPNRVHKKIIFRKMSKNVQNWTELNGRKGVTTPFRPFNHYGKLDEIKWTKGGDPPPSVHLKIRGDVMVTLHSIIIVGGSLA